jgi:predicted nucleic acid-binding protein
LVKKEKANMLLNPDFLISSQVVGENVNASKEVAFDHGDFIMSKLKLIPILPPTLKLAFFISNKYQFSWWDSLIIATALENNCEILYSEDMQNGLVIENTLTIVNPFL